MGKINISQQLTSTSTVSILETIVGCISAGAAGTLNGSILDTFYFSEMGFYKNNTKFQRKRGGRCPLGPSLNLPMHFSCSAQLFED